MHLFPLSLKERAKHWFNSLAPNSIASTPKAPKADGLFEVGHFDIATQVVDAITRKLDQLMVVGLALILLACTHDLNYAHFVLVLCII
jgi:hypothetical protein